MASLKKRKGIFQIQYYVAGNQRRISLGTPRLVQKYITPRNYAITIPHYAITIPLNS